MKRKTGSAKPSRKRNFGGTGGLGQGGYFGSDTVSALRGSSRGELGSSGYGRSVPGEDAWAAAEDARLIAELRKLIRSEGGRVSNPRARKARKSRK